MPNLTPKNLYTGNTTGNIYTAGSNVGDYTIIKNINFCNANASVSKSVTLYVVPSGGTANESTIYVSNLLIPPSDSIQIDSSIVMNQSGFISISHTGNVTTTISGVEYK